MLFGNSLNEKESRVTLCDVVCREEARHLSIPSLAVLPRAPPQFCETAAFKLLLSVTLISITKKALRSHRSPHHTLSATQWGDLVC